MRTPGTLLVGLALLLGACGPSGGDSVASSPTTTEAMPADVDEVTLSAGGEDRRYTLFVPDDLPAAGAALVVDLHGLSETPDRQDERSGMRAKAAAAGFVLAQPQGRSALPYWESAAAGTAVTGDVGFLRAVVADVSSRVSIDQGRVYATGLSNGGGMANRLACEAADVFAAVAPVAGAYTQHDNCRAGRPVPMMIFHGDEDPVVPFDGVGELFPPIETYAARWAARNSCRTKSTDERLTDDVTIRSWDGCEDGAEVTLFIIEGGGHGWPGSPRPEAEAVTTMSISATDLIWEFFEEHRLS